MLVSFSPTLPGNSLSRLLPGAEEGGDLLLDGVVEVGEGELEAEHPELDQGLIAWGVQDLREKGARDRFVGGLSFGELVGAAGRGGIQLLLHPVQELAHVLG